MSGRCCDEFFAMPCDLSISLELSIQMPNIFRTAIISRYIESAYHQLRQRYEGHHIVGALIDKPGLWEALADRLDTQVMYSIAKSIGRLRVEQHPMQSVEEYYERVGLSAQLEDEQLIGMMNRLAEDFVVGTGEMFERLISDFNDLKGLFLPEGERTQKDYHFADVSFAEGEMHKPGRQVAILTLRREGGPSTKFVYKPTSVTSVLLSFGNMSETKRVLKERGENLPQKSAAEWVNDKIVLHHTGKLAWIRDRLPKHRVYHNKLRTYKVLPKDQPSAHKHYGYVEFVSHGPWFSHETVGKSQREIRVEMQEQLEQVANTLSSENPVENLDKLQKFVRERLSYYRKQLLDYVVEKQSADYILRNIDELHDYSYETGLLSSLSMLLGLTDQHHENIISTRQFNALSMAGLVSIDLETLFAARDLSIDSTGLFSGGVTGLLSPVEMQILTVEDQREFVRVLGFDLHKNAALLDVGGGHLVQALPLRRDFMAGCKEVIDAIGKSYPQFIADWLGTEAVKSMPVRILPYQTDDFVRAKDRLMCAHDRTLLEGIQEIQGFIREDLRGLVANKGVEEGIFLPDEVKEFVYLSQDFEEIYFHDCIPAFILPRADSQELQTFFGRPVFRAVSSLGPHSHMEGRTCVFQDGTRYEIPEGAQGVFMKKSRWQDKCEQLQTRITNRRGRNRLFLAIRRSEPVSKMRNQHQIELHHVHSRNVGGQRMSVVQF